MYIAYRELTKCKEFQFYGVVEERNDEVSEAKLTVLFRFPNHKVSNIN